MSPTSPEPSYATAGHTSKGAAGHSSSQQGHGRRRTDATPSHRNLGLALYRVRLEKGLSLRAMAQRMGYSSHSMFAELEKARRLPSEALLRTYERYFGLPDRSLLELRRQALIERAARLIPQQTGPTTFHSETRRQVDAEEPSTAAFMTERQPADPITAPATSSPSADTARASSAQHRLCPDDAAAASATGQLTPEAAERFRALAPQPAPALPGTSTPTSASGRPAPSRTQRVWHAVRSWVRGPGRSAGGAR